MKKNKFSEKARNFILQDEILKNAATELSKRIDFSVLASLLVEDGWVHLKVEGDVDVTEIYNWVEQNAKDHYHNYLEEYVFKSPADANWFRLRWETSAGEPIF